MKNAKSLLILSAAAMVILGACASSPSDSSPDAASSNPPASTSVPDSSSPVDVDSSSPIEQDSSSSVDDSSDSEPVEENPYKDLGLSYSSPMSVDEALGFIEFEFAGASGADSQLRYVIGTVSASAYDDSAKAFDVTLSSDSHSITLKGAVLASTLDGDWSEENAMAGNTLLVQGYLAYNEKAVVSNGTIQYSTPYEAIDANATFTDYGSNIDLFGEKYWESDGASSPVGIAKDTDLTTSYELSAAFKGAANEELEVYDDDLKKTNVVKEVHGGFLSYYKDSNNYLVTYAQWAPDDRAYEIRTIQTVGVIGGAKLSWNTDIWCDGSGVLPSAGFTLTVTVELSAESANLGVKIVSGSFTKSGAHTVSGDFSAGTSKLGFYAYNDEFNISDISMTEYVPEPTYYWSKINGNPEYTETDASTLTYTNSGWKSGFVGQEASAQTSYTISADILGTVNTSEHSEIMAGLLVWYQDDDNFLIAYAQWAEKERAHEIREFQMTGQIGGSDAGWLGDAWCDGSYVLPANGISMSVTASITDSGATFTLSASCASNTNGASWSKDYTWTASAVTSGPSKLGVYGQGDTLSYSNFKVA